MTNNSHSIKRMVEEMYSNRHQTGDVTFSVDAHQIRAHRAVLAALSPKYNAQFYGPHPDEGEICVSPFVSAAAFNVFLQFFYKQTVQLTMDNIESVLDLAKQSLVDEIIESCVNFLKKQIKANKLSVAYRLANLYDIESLRLDCEQRFITNTMDIFASTDFLQCDPDMLVHILKLDTLNCTEKNVFGACIAWGRAQCQRDGLDDEKPENLRKVLGSAIYQIRFSSINAEEFADLHKSMEGLFTADESIELLYITAKLKGFNAQKFNLTPRISMNPTNSMAQASASEPKQPPKEPREPREPREPKGQLKPFNMVPAWSFQCNRFIRVNKRGRKIDASGHSYFQFNCNERIRLHGIALYFRLDGANMAGFRQSFSINNKRCSDVGIYYNPTRKHETMVIFKEPIDGVNFFSCSFELPSSMMIQEPDLKPSFDINNMNFQFNGKWVSCIFFDQYLFR